MIEFTAYFFAFWMVMLFFWLVAPKDSNLGKYCKNMCLNITQCFNTFTAGHPDQSFSGRCGYNGRHVIGAKKIWYYLASVVDWLFERIKGETDHCLNAIEHDRPINVKYSKGWKNLVFIFVIVGFVHVVAQILIPLY